MQIADCEEGKGSRIPELGCDLTVSILHFVMPKADPPPADSLPARRMLGGIFVTAS